MITNYYTCTLLSEVVLNAQTATEGQQASLDYIPGANFLGMVAKQKYDELSAQEAFELFHSGDVCFGDGRMSQKGQPSFKVPASWFFLKGKGLEDAVYVHHHFSKEQREQFTHEGIQLKQARVGYFIPATNQLLEIKKHYALKSAHDRATRKSADKKMFGYESLPAGTEFTFKVDCQTQEQVKLIDDGLIGKQHLGRSRTAQYGLVEIAKSETPAEITKSYTTPGEFVLYAVSDWCFEDEYGRPSLQPDGQRDLLLPDGCTICWEKSQIRSRTFAPWNGKRQTREADRVVIEKGSVLVINADATASLPTQANFEKGIGLYRAEGLGQVWVNPYFLEADANGKLVFQLAKEIDDLDKSEVLFGFVEKHSSDEAIIKMVQARHSEEVQLVEYLRIINSFITKHGKLFRAITPSQWGAVRNFANKSKTKKTLLEYLYGIEKNEIEKPHKNENMGYPNHDVANKPKVKIVKRKTTGSEEHVVKEKDEKEKNQENENMGYLNHGVAKDLWEDKRRKYMLKEFIEGKLEHFPTSQFTDEQIPSLIEKLAATFQKQNRKS